MARNNTQNQNIDPAEYDNMLGNIKDWIGNIDTKVSFLLTVACIFLGYIIENDISLLSNKNFISKWYLLILLGITLTMALLSISSYILALRAISNHKETSYESVIFAGDIAKNTDFNKYNTKISRITADDLNLDKKKQIYITSQIYANKVKRYNSGLFFTIITVSLYVIFKVIVYQICTL